MDQILLGQSLKHLSKGLGGFRDEFEDQKASLPVHSIREF